MDENEETTSLPTPEHLQQRSKADVSLVTNSLAQKAGYAFLALALTSVLPVALDYIDVRAKITLLEMRSNEQAERLARIESVETQVTVLVTQQAALAAVVHDVATDVKELYRKDR